MVDGEVEAVVEAGGDGVEEVAVEVVQVGDALVEEVEVEVAVQVGEDWVEEVAVEE